jgi:lysozyme
MQTSQAGLDALRAREGFSSIPYADASGQSIGYGHFIKPGESFDEIDEATGAALLAQDVKTAEDAVNSLVKVDLSQAQFDALVSFVYNIGIGNFRGSTLLKKLNDGDYAGAAAQFDVWNRSQGSILQALADRRASEQAQFMSA